MLPLPGILLPPAAGQAKCSFGRQEADWRAGLQYRRRTQTCRTTSLRRTPVTAPTSERLGVEAFQALFDRCSNWGRWGPDDERGALNLITPEKRIQAAGLVREGTTVS